MKSLSPERIEDRHRPAPPRARTIALLTPALGTNNIGDHFIELAIRRMLGAANDYSRFTVRRPLAAGEIEQINDCSAVLLCGTNLYQHDWESELTPDMLSKIQVPIIPFGVGSSAAELNETQVGEETRAMIRALHERCGVGSVRDPHSAAVVAGVGVKNVIMTGCPVLFWAGRDELPPVQSVKQRRIVITARNWLMHHWPDNVDHPVQIELLRKLLEHFDSRQMFFAVHEDFDRRLIDTLNIASEIVIDSDDPGDYVKLYSDPSNVVLANRLHAGMLALASGVPAVFVGHDTRTYAFCQMMGLKHIDLFAENCAAQCIRRLETIIGGDVSEFEAMAAPFASLLPKMREFLRANALLPTN